MALYKDLSNVFMKTNRSGNKLTINEIDDLMSFSRASMIKLCNEKYKLSNDIRWNIWGEIFNNQLKNLIDLKKGRVYYKEETYFKLMNFFVANARNCRAIRKYEYSKLINFIKNRCSRKY